MTRTLFAPLLALCLAAPGCSEDERAIEVAASPDRQWYRTGQSIDIVGQVTDGAGRAVQGARVEWIVEPSGAATRTGASGAAEQRFLLGREGLVTVTGCVGARCDSVSLRVDDGSPVLEIASPRPGAEIDDPGGVPVAGSVSDSSASRVFVAGELVEVDELGRFEALVPARFGVNHLTVTASDGLTEESSLAMDVLWAPAFAPAIGAAGNPELGIERGIALSLGQALFDDGAAFDPSSDPLTEDLADVLALVASRMPLEDQIPDPAVDEDGFFLRIPAADPGPVESSIGVTGEGVEVFLRLSELRLTTEGQLDFADTTLDLAGTVVASVAAAADIRATKAGPEAPVEVELTSLLLALETVDGQFDSEETDAVFLLAEGALRTTIEEELLSGVEEALAGALPAILEDLLVGLDTGLADRELVLDDPLLAAPITFLIDGRLSSVSSQRGVELLGSLDTRVGTASDVAHQSRGVALLEAPGAEPASFVRGRALQVGVRLAFLNGLLHALWSSGALEIDLGDRLSSELGDLVEGGRISGLMAPVVRPPRGDETDRLVLSLGQLEVELDLPDGGRARFGVGIDTAVDADIVDNALVVLAPGDPRVRVWTIEAADNGVFTEDLIAAVLAIQWRQIREAIVDGLRFDLPVPELGVLGELAPELADLELSLELAEPPSLRRDTVMLHGVLRGDLP